MTRNHHRFNLFHCIQGDTYYDQESRPTKVYTLNAGDVSQNVGKYCHKRQEKCAGECDPRQYAIQVISGRFTRTDAGNKATVLFHIIGNIRNIDRDRRVEVGKENNQNRIQYGI